MQKILIYLLVIIPLFTIASSAYTQSNSKSDSTLLPLTKEILTVIKDGDHEELAEYFHPDGVRFSPYGHIDTVNDQVFNAERFKKHCMTMNFFTWGSADGTGDPIRMIIREYFKRFVYDVDFLNAEVTNLNYYMGGGNTIENIESVYNGLPYTESYFSGFDEKFGGMDWRSLKLVYKKHKGKFYLVGIIHSEWTI